MKIKILVMTLVTFCIIFAFPVRAQFPQNTVRTVISNVPGGQLLTTVYDVYCGIDAFDGASGVCPTENNTWIGNAIINNLILNQMIWIPICDRTIDAVLGDAKCIASTDTGTAYIHGSQESGYDSPVGIVRPSGGFGLAKISTDSLAYMSDPKSAPIPTDLALFIDDTFDDTIFGTTAYAASPFQGTFENLMFGLWKIARNISIAIFGLLLAVVGVMIIARSKISPQVVVTIYSVLPMVPVSLAFIFLSYPLIAVMYSFLGTFLGLAWSFMTSVILGTFFSSLASSFTMPVNNFWDLIVAGINGIVQIPATLRVGGATLFFLVTFGLIGTLIVLVALVFTFAKVFVSMMYTAVVSPFVGLISILPGKQGLLVNLFKRVIADVLALPLMIVVAGIGMTILAFVPSSGELNNLFAGFFINTFGAGFALIAVIIKSFIGLSIMWKARKARSMIESMLGGVEDLFGSASQGQQKRR